MKEPKKNQEENNEEITKSTKPKKPKPKKPNTPVSNAVRIRVRNQNGTEGIVFGEISS